MRSFDRKRRSLFNNHYICGTSRSASGTDFVEIRESSGAPIKLLEIKGLTEQKIDLDLFKKHKDYFKTSK